MLPSAGHHVAESTEHLLFVLALLPAPLLLAMIGWIERFPHRSRRQCRLGRQIPIEYVTFSPRRFRGLTPTRRVN